MGQPRSVPVTACAGGDACLQRQQRDVHLCDEAMSRRVLTIRQVR
jgi:hypothetical protein